MKEELAKITIKDRLKQYGCPIATEHEIWSVFYDWVVNSDTERWAKRSLELLRSEQEDIGKILNPGLEQALRGGEFGVRLRGIYLMAIGRAGE